MRDNPEKYHYYKEHPSEPSAALVFGQVAHKLLLEPDDFENDFIIAPLIDRRTKAGKEEFARFLELADGKTVVSAEDFQTARYMVDKCLSYPEICTLLNGEHEKPYFWTDGQTGEECKCRVDCINRDGITVVDYKTTTNASTEAFRHSIENYGYNFQSAMYLSGTGAKRFVFIAQEKNPPYSVNIIEASAEDIARGNEIYRRLINQYHYCRTTGDWFGPLGAKDKELYEHMTGTQREERITDALPWEVK